MLQQTQVERVLVKYPEFLKRYPTLAKLARASTSEVIKAWQGMGHNSRALRLQKLARIALEDFDGELPRETGELEKLPGIGRYTAHAVACFAFRKQVPVVDTNIARVLARLLPPARNPAASRKVDLWTLAEALLPARNVPDWNQALMDLGATICTAAKPRCGLCPLKALCASAHKIQRKQDRSPKLEPSRDGIPNRIYRGRVIEVLRTLSPGGSIRSSLLARAIKTDFRRSDRRWFSSLLLNLERDGLVRLHGLTRVSLPD